ncbi:MAG: hypothetical protein AAGE61_13645 [Pseudomonadota bacterium]
MTHIRTLGRNAALAIVAATIATVTLGVVDPGTAHALSLGPELRKEWQDYKACIRNIRKSKKKQLCVQPERAIQQLREWHCKMRNPARTRINCSKPLTKKIWRRGTPTVCLGSGKQCSPGSRGNIKPSSEATRRD